MVSDVRMKVQMRLDALIQTATKSVSNNTEAKIALARARNDYVAAQSVSAVTRSMFVREFPGCELTFTRQYVYVKLPSNYPQARTPIMGQLTPILTESLYPKGLSNKPF